MVREYAPITDASGQWLNIGDVITHATRYSSVCRVDVGVVTDVDKQNRTITWRRVEETYKRGVKTYDWAKRDTKITRTDLITKTGLTLAALKAKFSIPEREEEIERPEEEPLGTRIYNTTTDRSELA